MSGTRSHSKTERVIERPFLLIAAHGERGGARANARLLAITAATRSLLPDWQVRAGVLSGEPNIAKTLADVHESHVLVWPLFMCRGYFIDNALRNTLDRLSVSYNILDEFGSDPATVRLALRAMEARQNRQIAQILVVAHGSSKGEQSRVSTERFAGNLRDAGKFDAVACAYLEEPPFVREIIQTLPEGSTIVSLFAGDGLHGGEDMTKLLEASGRGDIRVICPAADTEAVAQIAADAALRHIRIDPEMLRSPSARKARRPLPDEPISCM